MHYKEPVRELDLEFTILPRELLVMGEFQRELSNGLKNKLMKSVARGFIIPLIVVDKGDGLYEIIDGQHRLEALDAMGEVTKVPAIIVPETFRYYPMILNVEKGDTIKDKCVKITSLYNWFVNHRPEAEESVMIGAVNYQPSLFSLAFGFTNDVIPAPSLIETLANKIDATLNMDVVNGQVERIRRGNRLGEIVAEVEKISDEVGFRDFNLKKAVVSKTTAMLWGRKRNVGVEFDAGIDMILEQMTSMDWWGFAD